jgi:probable F420-dependent oxidoreductase
MGSVLPEGRLVYGMQLPIQAQSTVFVEPWEADAGADDLRAIAQAADQAGFWYLGVCDHVAVPTDHAEAMGTNWWDTIATLGWLAGITSHTRLLSHITVPAYRHPLAVAKAWSTLDALSNGRAIMGAGAGHLEAEFAMLDTDFARRGALLDESIDALRAAFADEFATFAGPTWRFDGMGQKPRPIQPGGPPIWVGGSSRAAIRRAVERGDGWLPQGPVDAELVASIREQRKAARGDEPIDVGALVGAVYVGDPGWDVGRCLSGAPEKVAHVLRKYAAMGVGQVQVRFRSRSRDELLDQIAAFGTDVGPLLNP